MKSVRKTKLLRRTPRKENALLWLQSMPAVQVPSSNRDFFTFIKKRRPPHKIQHKLHRTSHRTRKRLQLLALLHIPAEIAAPNVVNILLASAISVLGNDGLLVEYTFKSSLTVATNVVISQSPTAGTPVGVGSLVQLVVSSGSAAMPNLINQTLATALAEATGLGLTLDVTQEPRTDVLPGIVVRQEPNAGQPLLIGSTAYITVSIAPLPTLLRAQLPSGSDLIAVTVTVQ